MRGVPATAEKSCKSGRKDSRSDEVASDCTAVIGVPVALFATRLTNVGFPSHQYAASADGQRFLLNVSIDESSVLPITVVQNWTADFKKDVSRR
jgi:hypothetical protein